MWVAIKVGLGAMLMRHALVSLTLITVLASSRLDAQNTPSDELASNLETEDIETMSVPQDLILRPGQTATSIVGRPGERKEREQVEGVEPMARINNRIRNRVEARIRNRIDRHYDPLANARSPFVIAGEEAAPSEPKRR